MKKKIKLFGIISNGLLLLALIMSLLHIPNHALLIVLGILTMVLIESPIYYYYLNKKSQTKKIYNFILFISTFFFVFSVFFSLQHSMVPVKIAAIVAVLSGGFILLFVIKGIRQNTLKFKEFFYMHYYILFIALLLVNIPIQFQAPDYTFNPNIENPSYKKLESPLIYVDEGHNNFHTLEDRLFATGELLKKDGYNVQSYKGAISIDRLKGCRIFIIVNALNEKNDDWVSPIYSAFTPEEIKALTQWVFDGGSLFMIADHMPFPGSINDLALQFGFEFENGHAKHTIRNEDYFFRSSRSLHDNLITNGRNKKEAVDSILTFSGSAFKIPEDATTILEFDSTWVSYNPHEAWVFEGIEPFSIEGFAQGAYKKHGSGRIVIYGEAMMFTAQLGAGLSWVKIGMNSEKCPNNYQLLLNSIHWLDGQMD